MGQISFPPWFEAMLWSGEGTSAQSGSYLQPFALLPAGVLAIGGASFEDGNKLV